MSDNPECPEWERHLPEKYICGTCDGREHPLEDCEECEGSGLWLKAIGRDRIDELEAVLRDMAFMSANKCPMDGDTHVDTFMPVATWKEFRP